MKPVVTRPSGCLRPSVSAPRGDQASRTIPPSLHHIVLRVRWVFRPLNLADLLAVMPFYCSIILDSDDTAALSILRVFRVFRVFRLFKLSKYNSGFKVIAQTLFNSWPALQILLFFVCLGMILFGSLVYYAELLACPVFQLHDKTMMFEEDNHISAFEDYAGACGADKTEASQKILDGRICCRYSCNSIVGVENGICDVKMFKGQLRNKQYFPFLEGTVESELQDFVQAGGGRWSPVEAGRIRISR